MNRDVARVLEQIQRCSRYEGARFVHALNTNTALLNISFSLSGSSLKYRSFVSAVKEEEYIISFTAFLRREFGLFNKILLQPSQAASERQLVLLSKNTERNTFAGAVCVCVCVCVCTAVCVYCGVCVCLCVWVGGWVCLSVCFGLIRFLLFKL